MKDAFVENVDECFALGEKYSRSPDAIRNELLHEVGEEAVQAFYAALDWTAPNPST